MDKCANPECPKSSFQASTRNHWVQIEEVRLVGQAQGEGPVQRQFAAVTCSKRCAIAVLTPDADAEDIAEAAESDRVGQMFGRSPVA